MTVISSINKTEYTFLRYLNRSLHQPNKAVTTLSLSANEWQQLLTMADRHEVLALLSHMLESDKIPNEQQLAVQAKTARTVHKAIQLQVLNARLTTLLEKEGIQAVTLKGCTVARFYPVPEFRKTTGIDLFVSGILVWGRRRVQFPPTEYPHSVLYLKKILFYMTKYKKYIPFAFGEW